MSDLAEIRKALAELQRSTGRIEEAVTALKEGDRDRERRLRRVENKQHWYSGAAAVVGAVVAYFTKAHT